MKILVLGGSGLIGSKLVKLLRQDQYTVVAASRKSGVNIVTGEGLAEVLVDAEVVVDVTKPPLLNAQAFMDFFEAAGRNIIAAELKAGVKHHVALSTVGIERMQASGIFRAKLIQETLIQESSVPYTILRSTQFFEFLQTIADEATVEQIVYLSPALVQPTASDDVAAALVDIAVNPPVNSIIEIAGPERVSLAQLIRYFFNRTGDSRRVEVDVNASYFGVVLNDQSLAPGVDARIGSQRFEAWFSKSVHKDG